LGAHDLLVVYDSAAEIAALKPDLTALGKVDCSAAIVTAPGEDGIDFVSRFFAPAQGVPEEGEDGIDFVSRFFAPAQGVPEDLVTGSAHCHWCLIGRSASARPRSKRASSCAAAACSTARSTAIAWTSAEKRSHIWKDTLTLTCRRNRKLLEMAETDDKVIASRRERIGTFRSRPGRCVDGRPGPRDQRSPRPPASA
jgi:hypothetical protein